MQKFDILIIGRHKAILKTVVRLINNNPKWRAMGAESVECAIRLFNSYKFNLVLFGGGAEEVSEHRLRSLFIALHPHTRLLRHYGGGSGLLFTEIREALSLK